MPFEAVSPELRVSMKIYYPRLFGKFHPITLGHFMDTFHGETATSENLLIIIEKIKESASELMCHPGYADEILIAGSVYNR
jgi:predicted glycoside hydrolase/deacetylase ChbG (UPF0249 family)